MNQLVIQDLSIRLRKFAEEIELLADHYADDDIDTDILADMRACAERLATLGDPLLMSRRKAGIHPLTPNQARVLMFIRAYLEKNACAPTRQEIADGLGFSSANGVQDCLRRMEIRGVLTLVDGVARGIRLNKRSVVQAAGSQS